MTDRFVDSSKSAGSTDGLSWDNAHLSLSAALSVATSSDRIFVANTHSFENSAAYVLTFPTSGMGLQILCVTPSGATGNSGLATGAVEGVGAASAGLSMRGAAYIYGITFVAGINASTSCDIRIGDSATSGHSLVFDNCNFVLRAANNFIRVNIGAAGATGNDDGYYEMRNCKFKFSGTTQRVTFKNGRSVQYGMSIDPTGFAPTTLYENNNGGNGIVHVFSSDFTGAGAPTNIIDASFAASTFDFLMTGCKLTTAPQVSGTPIGGPGSVRVRIHNCDSDNSPTQNDVIEVSYGGTVQDESTVVRSGGGAVSYKFDSSGNAKFPFPWLSYQGAIRNTVTGSRTLTIPFVVDSASDLTTAQIGIFVRYPSQAGNPLSGIATSDLNVLATATAHAADTSSWSGTGGFSNVTKQKLTATFAANQAGYVFYEVRVYAASQTVYVDMDGATLS